ncbi:hypothetical protein [Pseudomonas sp. Marseille-Q5115]|uniref:hypothetical protein n=1 Tax=Pseudomonas sp. Marseille-Q5115 TaxID=2866593 RepID=UPI001CE471D8|nr:hypothetical protein [Pseudomonas sp. Marseille-Q5115]
MTHVFCAKQNCQFIDTARRIGDGPGDFIATHSGLMLVELKVRHPDAVLLDEEEFLQALDRIHSTRPELSSEDRYERALMSPHALDFQHCEAGRSFKVPDATDPMLGTVYAQHFGCYWMFRGVTNLPHTFIMHRCKAVSRGEPWRLPL